MSRDRPHCRGELREGRRLRFAFELPVGVTTQWSMPYTGGIAGRFLPGGEVVRIGCEPPEMATSAICDPENHRELHAHFVPPEDREHPRYSGYHLLIPIETILESAEWLDEG